MANHIAHFEIFASDVERARKFYERVFGWHFEIGGPPDFYLITTGPPVEQGVSRGLIAKRQGPAAQGPLNSFRCTISVSSISETAAAIEAAGGKLRSALIEIPGVGKLVEFTDTDGNVACALQPEPGVETPSRG
jgi:predicted enzyme related to lactoylglutathione lyase